MLKSSVVTKHKIIELLAKVPLRIIEPSGSHTLITESGEVLFESEFGQTASFGQLESMDPAQISRLYELGLAQNLLLKK